MITSRDHIAVALNGQKFIHFQMKNDWFSGDEPELTYRDRWSGDLNFHLMVPYHKNWNLDQRNNRGPGEDLIQGDVISPTKQKEVFNEQWIYELASSSYEAKLAQEMVDYLPSPSDFEPGHYSSSLFFPADLPDGVAMLEGLLPSYYVAELPFQVEFWNPSARRTARQHLPGDPSGETWLYDQESRGQSYVGHLSGRRYRNSGSQETRLLLCWRIIDATGYGTLDVNQFCSDYGLQRIGLPPDIWEFGGARETFSYVIFQEFAVRKGQLYSSHTWGFYQEWDLESRFEYLNDTREDFKEEYDWSAWHDGANARDVLMAWTDPLYQDQLQTPQDRPLYATSWHTECQFKTDTSTIPTLSDAQMMSIQKEFVKYESFLNEDFTRDERSSLAARVIDSYNEFDGNMIAYLADFGKFGSTAKSIIDLVRNPRNPKSWANAWLSGRYADRLTIASTNDLVDAVQHHVDLIKRTGLQRWGVTAHRGSLDQFKPDKTSGLYYAAERYLAYNMYTSAGLLGDMENVLASLHRWDIAPTLENLWDLLPYSFVVDWCANISEFFSVLDAMSEAPLIDAKAQIVGERVATKMLLSDFRYDLSGTLTHIVYSRRRHAFLRDISPIGLELSTPRPINIIDGAALGTQAIRLV